MTIRPGDAFRQTFGGETPGDPEVQIAYDGDFAPGSFHDPVAPASWDEAYALPPGTHFYDPAGILRIRD